MHPNPKKSKLLAAFQAIRQDFEAEVMREIDAHPESPYWMVAQKVGLSEASVLRIAQKNSISRPAGPRPKTETAEEGACGEQP
ncbi:MAG: hypothetical protein WCF30_20575 [Terracidiphilus sp.]